MKPTRKRTLKRVARLKRDEALFSAEIEAVYLSAAEPSHWPQALKAIADCFGDVGAVLLYIRTDGSIGTIVSADLAAAQRDYEQRWVRDDIRAIRGFPVLHQRETLTDRHIVSEQEIAEHPIYREFLIPHGLGWFGAVRMLPDPKIIVLISVQRSSKKPPFADDELEVLAQLGRHAEHALRLSVRLMNAEVANAGLQDALNRIGAGIIVLDRKRNVVFANATGSRHLSSAFAMVNDKCWLGSSRIARPSAPPSTPPRAKARHRPGPFCCKESVRNLRWLHTCFRCRASTMRASIACWRWRRSSFCLSTPMTRSSRTWPWCATFSV
jgi:hypothetical protein